MARSSGRRRSGTGDAADKRRGAGLAQLPWKQFRNPYDPIKVISDDHIEAIHNTSLKILEEIGMDFLHPEAREILAAAGARVESGDERVRFDRGLIEEAIAKAPKEVLLRARNPAHDLTLGGNHVSFASVASAPYVSDLEGGRRTGNFKDFCDLIRLCQSLNVVQLFGGYPVEPTDLPPATRHLDALRALLTLGDKAIHAYSLGRTRVLDALEMVKIAFDLDDEELDRGPCLFSIINTSSPLRLDHPMLDGIIELSRRNQLVIITPFTLSGAMSPATLAGALAQQNAEALAGIAFTQIVKPGSPVGYGGFTSNVDMKSGAPAFGTPEYTKAALAGGQLARRYGFPYRSSNANASNTVDAQAAYESEMSLWGAVMGHANMVMHGAGWMEGGLTASFEKVVMDAEILQLMGEFMQPIVVNEETLGLDAIREVGPGGHFFGAAHTLSRYEDAFYSPILSDWRNFESWEEAGGETATERAHKLYKSILSDYSLPPIDPARTEALDAFVERRTREGGAEAA